MQLSEVIHNGRKAWTGTPIGPEPLSVDRPLLGAGAVTSATGIFSRSSAGRSNCGVKRIAMNPANAVLGSAFSCRTVSLSRTSMVTPRRLVSPRAPLLQPFGLQNGCMGRA
jgi:hypothetical protein